MGYSESTSVLETGFGAIENTSIHHADSVVAGISPCQPGVFKPSTLFGPRQPNILTIELMVSVAVKNRKKKKEKIPILFYCRYYYNTNRIIHRSMI